MLNKNQLFERRKKRSRYKLRKFGGDRPRLSVFRSSKHIYVQLIDDNAGKTLASASTVEKAVAKSLKTGADMAAAAEVGRLIAGRAKEAGVEAVVFDRGGYRFHGRLRALADAARESGLKF